MKERPILFSGEMVRAILSGRKTQTRRVVKQQVEFDSCGLVRTRHGELVTKRMFERINCPYGQVGDRLWVRESFWYREEDGITWYDDGQFRLHPTSLLKNKLITPTDPMEKWHTGTWQQYGFKRKPSIHMPRWASRITLEIVNIRVQRLQDVTDDDAEAEGVDTTNASICGYCKKRFEKLWDSINAKRGYSWKSNPWVWVIEFKRIVS